MNINSISKNINAQINAAKAQEAPKATGGEKVEQSNSNVQNNNSSSTLEASDQHSEVVSVDGPDANIQESDNLADFSTSGDTQSYISDNDSDDYYETPGADAMDQADELLADAGVTVDTGEGQAGEGVTQVNVDEQTETVQETEQINENSSTSNSENVSTQGDLDPSELEDLLGGFGGFDEFPGFPEVPGDLDLPGGFEFPDPMNPDAPGTGEGEGGAVQRPHEEGNRNVYVVDTFDPEKKIIDIDKDGEMDLTHGELVSELIEAEDESANVHRVDHGDGSANSHAEILTDLAERKKNGEDIDAVNMSQGVNFNIDSLGDTLGLELTNENIGEHKEQIMEYLKETEDPHFEGTYETILALEELAAAGVDVYVAAGNGGPGNVNTYNLAEGTIDVGANKEAPEGVVHKDQQGNVLENDFYSGDNDLVDVEAQGTISYTRVEGGYDINGDGKADLEGTFGRDDVEIGTTTNAGLGTSYSTPIAAANQMGA